MMDIRTDFGAEFEMSLSGNLILKGSKPRCIPGICFFSYFIAFASLSI